MTRRRRLLGLAAAALALTAPSASAAIDQFSFDDLPADSDPTNAYSGRGIVFDNGCGGYRVTAIGPLPFEAHSGGQALLVPGTGECAPTTYISATAGPRVIQFWARTPGTTASALTVTEYLTAGASAITERRTLAPGWNRITLRAPGNAAFALISPRGEIGRPLYIDDLATDSELPSPMTVIDEAPPVESTSAEATVRFHGTETDSTFTCALDAQAPVPCSGAANYSGLADGEHTVVIQATGLFGDLEASPPVARWRVSLPVPPPPPPVPCAAGPDSDGDGLSDACDSVGESGRLAPVSGERARVAVRAGTVFIKLPAAATGSLAAAGGSRAQRSVVDADTDPGFVPLKGVATVPVGSTVDARSGSIDLVTASGASASGSGPERTASARLSAAIFQIRQRRAARKTKRHPKPPPSPTQLLLRTPEATLASQLCASKSSTATIRTLSAVVPKGVFQIVGVAATVSTATGTASIRTTDRCDGTFTAVGSGSALVRDGRRHRTIRVRSGRGYLVRGNYLALSRAKGR